jgi:lambda repressor-like predicted transcriptional regulator
MYVQLALTAKVLTSRQVCFMMDSMTKDFNRIKAWLLPIIQQKGVSLEAVGRAAGISRASMYHYLNDKRRPTPEVMRRICDVLERPHEEGLAQYSLKPVGRPKGAY